MSTNITQKKWRSSLLAGAMLLQLAVPQQAQASSEPFIGDIMMFGGNFCPRNWTDASGQLLAINSNTALFSLYGTIYGGDGRTTFALPDLRSRVPIGAGTGPGLTPRSLGSRSGLERFSVTASNLAHTHTATTESTLHATSTGGTVNTPAGLKLSDDGNDKIYNDSAVPNSPMNVAAIESTTTVSATGNSEPVNTTQAYTGIRYCVALFGSFPSRN